MCCIKHDKNHTTEYYETVKKIARKCSGVLSIFFFKEKWKPKNTEQKTVLNIPKKGCDAKCVYTYIYVYMYTHTHMYNSIYIQICVCLKSRIKNEYKSVGGRDKIKGRERN